MKKRKTYYIIGSLLFVAFLSGILFGREMIISETRADMTLSALTSSGYIVEDPQEQPVAIGEAYISIPCMLYVNGNAQVYRWEKIYDKVVYHDDEVRVKVESPIYYIVSYRDTRSFEYRWVSGKNIILYKDVPDKYQIMRDKAESNFENGSQNETKLH